MTLFKEISIFNLKETSSYAHKNKTVSNESYHKNASTDSGLNDTP
jgi:hypothetical protein